jgi:hypothetical protein
MTGTRVFALLHRRGSLLRGLCALAIIVLVSGCSEGRVALPYRSPQSIAQTRRIAAAKNAIAPAMADVEACELAVLRGTSIDELSYLAKRARSSTSAFARTQNSKLVPRSTRAIVLAARYYSDSCAAWRAEDNAAQDALHMGLNTGSWAARPGTTTTDRHYLLWVEAARCLGGTRMALKDGPP